MNQNQFLNDKNKYESKQVEEVIDYRKKPKHSHIKWAVVAVCLLLIFIVVCIGIFSMAHEDPVVINLYDANCVADYLPPSPGKFTESDLVHFKTNPEYGYRFRFVINGDGSGITVDEKDLITEIPQDR